MPVPSFGGGPPSPPSPGPPVSNARLGMLMLISAETMLFTGLIGAYVMFRFGSVAWPSAHLYLPVGVTWVNTFVLLTSCYTMHGAIKAVRADNQRGLVNGLSITGLLGTLFLSIQGYEWTQLIRDGLTISTGIYGATFYTLIGCHASHVLAAVLWLLIVVWQARRGRFSLHRHVGVEICGMYWYYVGALWVVLFGLVYLN
ncbi:MAG: heme-copper oxidase subunit III [Nitrospinae bacterium]|nr:heme-copper oxidase subunit III [Nitrospinota bacterium]